MICSGFLFGVPRIKRSIGGFIFGSFLIVILKCVCFCDQRSKEFKVSKVFSEYICPALDREVHGSKYLSGSQSSPSC